MSAEIGLIDPTASAALAQALAAARAGDAAEAERLIALVEERRDRPQVGGGGAAELRLIEAIRTRFGLHGQNAAKRGPGKDVRVSDHAQECLPGVTVVTCCMNRTENLLRAMPTWLEHDQVREVVVIDWSSREPVLDSLRGAGLLDRRVRVIRVVDEPRWILSYAFNLGFRFARHELILKLDADIMLRPGFFDRNPLVGGLFIAGDWQVAEKGQEHINGFFYAHRCDLLRIKGFNEYITTYGWDDDDIYARLSQSGIRRVCVDTQSIYHIPHDDAQRLGSGGGEAVNAVAQLRQDTLFKIRANRYLAMVMPPWNDHRTFAPFQVLHSSARYCEVLRVVSELPHIVTPDIRTDAEMHAALELVSWRVGPRAYHAPRPAFSKLLETKRLEQISPFDVALAVHDPAGFAALKRHSLLIELDPAICESTVMPFCRWIDRQIDHAEVAIFVVNANDPVTTTVKAAFEGRSHVLAQLHTLDRLPPISPSDLHRLDEAVRGGPGAHLVIDATMLSAFDRLTDHTASDAPALVRRQRKLYVDVQHGLGNRLRALASAAAIAKRTERQLVLLWTPDHHCDCRFADLFEPDITVVESPNEVPDGGVRRYSYMELEPGARKDEPIDLDTADDVLVRSAYVLKHPASQWSDENAVLRALRPAAPVAALVSSLSVEGCIGAHVRMEAGKGLDHNSYDSSANWSQASHDDIQYWRDKSHYSAFMRRIDTLLEEQPGRKLFLATDLPENYEVFQRCYGNRLLYLPRRLYDRSREQIIYALADALLLSRCEMLLGSTWSSFSELAMRMSTTFSKVEMSGRDF